MKEDNTLEGQQFLMNETSDRTSSIDEGNLSQDEWVALARARVRELSTVSGATAAHRPPKKASRIANPGGVYSITCYASKRYANHCQRLCTWVRVSRTGRPGDVVHSDQVQPRSRSADRGVRPRKVRSESRLPPHVSIRPPYSASKRSRSKDKANKQLPVHPCYSR